jgi:hypothetical protein
MSYLIDCRDHFSDNTCQYNAESICVVHSHFGGVRVTQYLVFCVVFCRSLFALFVIILSAMVSEYPYKLFLAFGYPNRDLNWTALVDISEDINVYEVHVGLRTFHT